MCTSGEDEPGDAGAATSSGAIEEVVATAPRIGISPAVYDQIDWTEVLPQAVIGTVGGALASGPIGALAGELAAVASSIEAQENVDLQDLLEIHRDILVVPGLPQPYIPLY